MSVVYNAGVSGMREAKKDKINVRIRAITGILLFCSGAASVVSECG